MSVRACLQSLAVVALAVVTVSGQSITETPHGEKRPTRSSLRITSPQGRTGTVTRIRIVAQIETPPGVQLSPVDFFVDGEKAGTVENGPPWAVDWTDDNPLLKRDIVVQATDSNGVVLRDAVTLPAWEVTDETEVSGVLLETSVYDANGRYVSDLPNDAFTVEEDRVAQRIDLVTKETVPNELVADGFRPSRRRTADRQHAADRSRDRRAVQHPYRHHHRTDQRQSDDFAGRRRDARRRRHRAPRQRP
jgi:hypothetical protein